MIVVNRNVSYAFVVIQLKKPQPIQVFKSSVVDMSQCVVVQKNSLEVCSVLEQVHVDSLNIVVGNFEMSQITETFQVLVSQLFKTHVDNLNGFDVGKRTCNVCQHSSHVMIIE